MRTGGDPAIGIIPSVAENKGLDGNCVTSMGTLLVSNGNMGVKSQPRTVDGKSAHWMLIKKKYIAETWIKQMTESQCFISKLNCNSIS